MKPIFLFGNFVNQNEKQKIGWKAYWSCWLLDVKPSQCAEQFLILKLSSAMEILLINTYSKKELIVYFCIDLVYFSAFIRVFFDQYFFLGLFRPTYIFSLCKVTRFKLDPFNAYSADSLSANKTFLPIRNGILLPKLFWLTVRKKCSSD